MGDGCMGKDVLCGDGNPDKGPYYQVEFLHGHGQVSERNYRAIRTACPEAALRRGGDAAVWGPRPDELLARAVGALQAVANIDERREVRELAQKLAQLAFHGAGL